MKNIKPIAFFAFIVQFVAVFSQQYVLEYEFGKPSFAKDHIVLRFVPDSLNPATIDSISIFRDSLWKFVSAGSRVSLEQHLSGISNWEVQKLFPWETTHNDSIVNRLGNKVPRTKIWSNLLLFMPSTQTNPKEVVELLNLHFDTTLVKASIDWVVPDDYVPNDPDYVNQGCLNNASTGTTVSHVQVERAWDFERFGKPFVRIAIIDGGIDQSHPDIFVSGGINLDGGTPGPLTSPFTYGDHGTRVAGLAGGIADNNQDIAGVAGGTSLIDVSCTAGGTSLMSQRAQQIMLALGLNCHILNASWSRTQNEFTFNQFGLLGEAVYNAYLQEAVLVATRGNNNDDVFVFPGCFDDRMAITVGGSDITGERANAPSPGFGSSFGPPMDFLAPGSDDLVITTDNGGGTTTFAGTSGSAPIVSGVAGLMISNHDNASNSAQNLTPTDIEHILEATSVDKGTVGVDPETGSGLIDAGDAIFRIQSPKYEILHFTEIGGNATLETVSLRLTAIQNFFNAPIGLPDATYLVDRYKVTKTVPITLPPNTAILGAWVRDQSSIGWINNSIENVLDGLNTVYLDNWSSTSLTFHTYIYDIYSFPSATYLGMFPTNAGGVRFDYTLWLDHTNLSVPISPAVDERFSDIQVFPNPVTFDYFSIRSLDFENHHVDVEVVDLFGRTLAIYKDQVIVSGKDLQLDLPEQLDSGTYLINVVNRRGQKNWFKVNKLGIDE